MDNLLRKYNDYMRLKDCKVVYELSNSTHIEVTYAENNFAHLIGLHKLKDIQLIQFWQDKTNNSVKLSTVIKRIKNSTFTENMVKASVFYPLIQERYENFNYNNLTTLNYTDAVVNFNPNIIHSKIKSDYLLFEQKGNNVYNHLGIALDKKKGYRYFETFFQEPTNMYLSNQTVVKINHFTLYDKNNNIIVTDSF